MLAWALDGTRISLWEILRGEPIPKILDEAIEDPHVMFAAWNSPFERYIFRYVLKRDIPANRWLDPQASARYLSLPDDLETAAKALNLPREFWKDEAGDNLVKIFSTLTIPRKVRAKKGVIIEQPKPYFRDWFSDPLLWDDFGEYCKQDVASERELARRLAAFQVYPLPEREQRLWHLDQKINDRGMPTDREFARKAGAMAMITKNKALDKLKEITKLENPNSDSQMLAWAQSQGYEPNTLRKEYVAFALDDTAGALTDEAREAFEIRKISRSTSYTKLAKIQQQLSPDDQLKDQFIFMGSSRAGRWSSGASQLHNMARPTPDFEEEENLEAARRFIYAEDYDGFVNRFGEKNVMPGVKSSIRSCFVAKPGRRLNVADLNAIETRVGAWLAGCHSLLSVFARPHGDPYLEFASKMTGIPYEDLDRDIHSTDKKVKAVAKRHRQIAKPGVLGCIYRLGPGGWGRNKYGDPIKVGLWGYAENMGVKMDLETARHVVAMFREAYPEIVQLWYRFEACVSEVLKGSRKATSALGPGDCVKFDKINRKGQNPILRIQLPSGRYLHYIDARLEDTKMPWTKKIVQEDNTVVEVDVYRPTLVYAGVNKDTKQWEPFTTSHGGKLTENVVQAIARDVLAEGMLRADAEDAELCGHVHDELISDTADNAFSFNCKDLERCMSRPMPWAPTLPLGADGYSGSYYHK